METITEALVACVKACGGSKAVGPKLWPEKEAFAAQRYLLDCLNEDRPQQLSPEHVMLILRMAREKGCHIGMQFLAESLSYAEPVPIQPQDESDDLKRQFIGAVETLGKMAQRIEQLDRLRVVS